LAVPDASFEGKAAQSELERLLSATLAALTMRDQRLAQPTDELRECADRLLVQTSLVEQKDAELVDMRARLDELLLSRDQLLHALEQALQEATSCADEAEERSRRAHEQTALVEQKDAELVEMRAKLDELLLSSRSHDQQVRALEQALQKATSRAADADERHEAELVAVRLRLTDAEDGWAKSKREADRLRTGALTTTDFVGTNEDRITRESVRRIQAMDAETEWSDKNSVVSLYRNEG
jgi:chromosome segregation ATPase